MSVHYETPCTYVFQQFDKSWIWRSICKTKTAEIWQNDILTLDGLEKGQLIQLDDATRIKLAFRNQGQLAPFVCYLVFKIGNFAIDITEQKHFLSNCSKQLVTPVNLTRNFFLTNYLIPRSGSELAKLKTAFYESHFPHCVLLAKNWHANNGFYSPLYLVLRSKVFFNNDFYLAHVTTLTVI